VIDLLREDVLPLAEAAKWLPPRRRGKRPHRTTLDRWAKVGYRGVFLEVVKVGDTTCTSAQALQRFVSNLTAGIPSQTQSSENCDRQMTEDAIERELDRRGVPLDSATDAGSEALRPGSSSNNPRRMAGRGGK
jgi:hypothetical protein